MTERGDGRAPHELRPVQIARGVMENAEGSVLIEVGKTRLLCTATVEERVPDWMREAGHGWVTAEYGMLPRSTADRLNRERSRTSGRTMEIQRLIGRSLRAVVDVGQLGPRTVILDCDVLQADGGTRTAAITGAFVALVDALQGLRERGLLAALPLTDFLAATSVGIVGGVPMLDLAYREDSAARVDLNLVMTGSGHLVEVQSTGEGAPFTQAEFQAMLCLGEGGIRRLIEVQRGVLGSLAGEIGDGGHA